MTKEVPVWIANPPEVVSALFEAGADSLAEYIADESAPGSPGCYIIEEAAYWEAFGALASAGLPRRLPPASPPPRPALRALVCRRRRRACKPAAAAAGPYAAETAASGSSD